MMKNEFRLLQSEDCLDEDRMGMSAQLLLSSAASSPVALHPSPNLPASMVQSDPVLRGEVRSRAPVAQQSKAAKRPSFPERPSALCSAHQLGSVGLAHPLPMTTNCEVPVPAHKALPLRVVLVSITFFIWVAISQLLGGRAGI